MYYYNNIFANGWFLIIKLKRCCIRSHKVLIFINFGNSRNSEIFINLLIDRNFMLSSKKKQA
jgi:hypothetical protein